MWFGDFFLITSEIYLEIWPLFCDYTSYLRTLYLMVFAYSTQCSFQKRIQTTAEIANNFSPQIMFGSFFLRLDHFFSSYVSMWGHATGRGPPANHQSRPGVRAGLRWVWRIVAAGTVPTGPWHVLVCWRARPARYDHRRPWLPEMLQQ